MKHIGQEARPFNDADPDNFVLPAQMQRLLGKEDGEALRLYRVNFAEGARTHWHRHDDIQLLFGLSGQCVVVDRSGREVLLESGDVVVVDPEEEHWHGAAPGGGGEHLAINVGTETKWLEPS